MILESITQSINLHRQSRVLVNGDEERAILIDLGDVGIIERLKQAQERIDGALRSV